MKWFVLCFGLAVCVASFQAVAEAPQSLKEKCLTQSYPPPPADKTKLPEPVRSCIQMIMDLCQHDNKGVLKLTLKEQAPLLQSAIKGLIQALPYYINHYSEQVNSSNLRRIRSNLLDGIYIHAFWNSFWEDINNGRRKDIVGSFLWQRVVSYNLESDAGPESFSRDWEHQIYEGLYCISHGKLPPASSFPTNSHSRVGGNPPSILR